MKGTKRDQDKCKYLAIRNFSSSATVAATGGMPNPNYMGVMGPMGVGYGGPIDQYGRPSSRPMTPTGGMQLGMMPGMGAVSASLLQCV